MKQKHILLGSLLLAGCAAVTNAKITEVKNFRILGPYEVNTPVMIDSTDVSQKKYDVKALLDPKGDVDKAKPWSGATIKGGKGRYNVGTLVFDLYNSSYTNGEISVNGLKNYKVFVDGSELADNKLNLEPNSHVVTINYAVAPSTTDSVKVSIDTESDVTVGNSGERLYDLHTCMDGNRVFDVKLSPSGKYAIVYHQLVERGGKTTYDAKLMTTDTFKELGELTGKLEMQWMPNKDSYVYEVRHGANRCLYMKNVATGKESCVAQNVPDGDFVISPNGKYLIISEKVEGPAEAEDVSQVLDPEDRQPGYRDRYVLTKYDLTTGVSERLTYGHTSAYLQDISADGNKVMFMVTKMRFTKRPFDLHTVYQLDVNTMKVDTLMTDAEFVDDFTYSPDGKSLLVKASPEAFNGIGKNVKEGQIPSMNDGQLYIYDIATKQCRPMTKYFNPSVEDCIWSVYTGQIYFTALDRDCRKLFTLNPKTGKISSMNVQEECVDNYMIAENGSTMMYYGQSAMNSLRLYVGDAKTCKWRCVEDYSAEILKNVKLGECKAWDFVSERGDTICGRYYLPPHFDATKKYPMIVNYYGGCSPISRTMESRYPAHAYAAQGYVVYVLEPSGATGFGQEFSARHVNGWGKVTPDDIVEGTKKFCNEHSFVDSKKIGCIGASYGGYMTQYLTTYTDIFAAAVSHAGISNIASYWGFGYWGYSYSALASANSYPWNNPKMYTENSPLFRADKVNTPLLFVHGNADTNVPINESVQMFTALKLLGKETAFVVVDGQNHHIKDYNKRFKWQATIFAWFAKYLKGEPQWWDSMYSPKDL